MIVKYCVYGMGLFAVLMAFIYIGLPILSAILNFLDDGRPSNPVLEKYSYDRIMNELSDDMDEWQYYSESHR